jgi:protein phosphatase methylesterase 1
VDVVWVGHSLGGAVVANVCAAQAKGGDDDVQWRCAGSVVIEMAEEHALRALVDMPRLLEMRPQSFASIQEAVEWVVKSGTVNNRDSAVLSVPKMVALVDSPSSGDAKDGQSTRVAWRVNLRHSQAHWEGWFTGFSEAFLGLKCLKLLVINSPDRLDTPLSRGSMQGKFQCHVMPNVGHNIQEDAPRATAFVLKQFADRYLRNRELLPPS